MSKLPIIFTPIAVFGFIGTVIAHFYFGGWEITMAIWFFAAVSWVWFLVWDTFF